MTKYFADAQGNYIGAFDGDNVVYPNGVEVPFPPFNAKALWNGTTWTEPAVDAFDLDDVNQALAQPGSIVRALGIVTFQEINKLRVKAGLTAYTMDQFITALKANLR